MPPLTGRVVLSLAKWLSAPGHSVRRQSCLATVGQWSVGHGVVDVGWWGKGCTDFMAGCMQLAKNKQANKEANQC